MISFGRWLPEDFSEASSPKTFPKLAQEPLFWTSGYTAIKNIGMFAKWWNWLFNTIFFLL
jgi:hypothetical protein